MKQNILFLTVATFFLYGCASAFGTKTQNMVINGTGESYKLYSYHTEMLTGNYVVYSVSVCSYFTYLSGNYSVRIVTHVYENGEHPLFFVVSSVTKDWVHTPLYFKLDNSLIEMTDKKEVDKDVTVGRGASAVSQTYHYYVNDDLRQKFLNAKEISMQWFGEPLVLTPSEMHILQDFLKIAPTLAYKKE
jgi:hypothetical protein